MESIDPQLNQSPHLNPVAEQQVDSVNLALPDAANPSVLRAAQTGREVPLWGRLTAGALMVAGAFGLGSTGDIASANTPARKEPVTTTKPERAKPNKMEVNPQVAVPTSRDPEALARAWMTNYVNWTNTGNEKFLAFYVVDMGSDVSQLLQADRQEVADYQAQGHAKYHRDIADGAKGLKIVPEMTDFLEGGKTITVDVKLDEYLDNRAVKPHSSNIIRKQFTVSDELERTVTTTTGTVETAKVLLPAYIQNLGTPPAEKTSKKGFGSTGF